MKKIIIVMVCIALLFAVSPLFAGGGKETTEGTEEKAAESGRPYEGTELSIIVRSGRGTKELLEDYADEVYEKFGITFTIPDLPFSKLHDQLITDFVSGAGSYDVLLVGSSWVGEMENYLEVLDPYIEKNNFDMDDYFENLQKYSGLNSSGERVGIPNKTDCMTFYYRTDIIDELGLGDPADWGWKEFIEAEKAIQDSGLVRLPFVTAGVDIQLVKLFFAHYVPYGDITTSDARPLFNSQTGINALERIKEIFSYSTEDIYALDNNDASNIFYSGEAAMLFNWPVAVKEVNNPDFSDVIGKWAATAPPGPGNVGSDLRAISGLSKKKDASWALVSWLHSAEMTQEIVKYTGQLPGRKSVAQSDLTAEYIPGAAGVSAAMKEAYIIDTHSKALPNYFKWFVDVGKQIGKYLTGTQSAQEALTTMENTWNEVNKEQIGNVEVIPVSQQK